MIKGQWVPWEWTARYILLVDGRMVEPQPGDEILVEIDDEDRTLIHDIRRPRNG